MPWMDHYSRETFNLSWENIHHYFDRFSSIFGEGGYNVVGFNVRAKKLGEIVSKAF